MSCNMCRDGKTALGRPCPNNCPVPSPDTDKLVRWLRGLAERQVNASGSRATFVSDMYFEAADAIEQARAEILSLSQERDRLREALAPFATLADSYDPDEGDSDQLAWGNNTTTIGDLRRARAALNKEPPCQET